MNGFGAEQLDDNIAVVFETSFEAFTEADKKMLEARGKLNAALDSLNTSELVDFFNYTTADEELVTIAYFAVRKNLRYRKNDATESTELDAANEIISAKYKEWISSEWSKNSTFQYLRHPQKFSQPLARLYEYGDAANASRNAENGIKAVADDLTPEEITDLVKPGFSPNVNPEQACWILGEVLLVNYTEALEAQNKTDLARYAIALAATGDESMVEFLKDWKPEA